MNKKLRITWFYDNILTNNSTAICKKDYNRMNEQKYLINNEKLNQILFNTYKKYWWKCEKCNYEWESTPYNRFQGKGCPKCWLKKIGKKNSLKVNQYDKNGKYIQTFNSITEAMKKTLAKKIIDVCKGRRKMSGRYIWKYFND